jgi:protein phosphatase 2C-like protein
MEGTSHRQSGVGCQDSSFVSPYPLENDEVLILACSDGAGSAIHSQIGSKLACITAVQQVAAFFDTGRRVEHIDKAILGTWMASIHATLEAEAAARSIPSRELACTFLLSVVGRSASAFAQIGDGAIVILENEYYRPIFWPQNGEYQNTTFFLTEAQFADKLQLEITTQPIHEVAMFSDGLQMLALNYANREAHQPFFSQLFQALRTASPSNDLIVPMREFLDSKPINDRTDDDKTLILATRVACADSII